MTSVWRLLQKVQELTCSPPLSYLVNCKQSTSKSADKINKKAFYRSTSEPFLLNVNLLEDPTIDLATRMVKLFSAYDFDIRHMSNTGIDFLGLAYKLVGWDSVGRWTEPLAQFNSSTGEQLNSLNSLTVEQLNS